MVKTFLKDHYGDGVRQVLLFGSFARGEATENSDIDLLIIVRQTVDPLHLRERLDDLLYDIVLNNKELISIIVIDDEHYQSYNSPFLLNIKEEGIIV